LILSSLAYFLFGIAFGCVVANAIESTYTSFKKSEKELDESRRQLEIALLKSGAIEKVLEEREKTNNI